MSLVRHRSFSQNRDHIKSNTMVKPNDCFKRVLDTDGRLFKVTFEAPSPDTMKAYTEMDNPDAPKNGDEAVVVHKVNKYIVPSRW